MRKFLLLLCTLLGTVGAWADVLTLTPSNGTYPTSSGNYVNTISFSTTPAITVSVDGGANNMDKRLTDTYLQWHSGTAGTSTYTMSVADDYVITGYSITGEANTSAQTLTAGSVSHEFAVGTSSSFEVTGLFSSSVSFVQTGANASGLKITSISVTVKNVVVTSLSGFSNNKAYYVTTYNRGAWFVASGGTAVTSTTNAGFAPSMSDTKQQFAFLTYGTTGVYHLYSISEGKFVSKSGQYTTLTSELGDNVTLLSTSNANYPVAVALQNGAYQMGISNGYDPAVITFYNDLNDGGNQVKIREVGDFDSSAAMAILEAAYSTTVSVTYEVYDGSTFVESLRVVQDKNSAVAIPAALQKNTWYYDYAASGSIGESDCTITVNRTYKTGVVTSLSGLSNNKAYRLVTERGTFTTDNGNLDNTCKSGSAYTVYNFAIVKYEDAYYLWSVQEGKFAAGNDKQLTITPTAITVNTLDEPLFKIQCGSNYLNCNTNSGGFFSSWSTTDGGNRVAIIEAADFDPTPVISALTNLAPSVNANIKPFFDAAGTGLFQLKSSVAETYNATYTAALTNCSEATYETLEDVVTNIDNFDLPEAGKLYLVKNNYNGKYMRVTASGTHGTVFADLTAEEAAKDASAHFTFVENASHLYMSTQGEYLNWVYGRFDGYEGYTATNFDKYVHFAVPAPGVGAFSIAYGNGEGDYAGYLGIGFYALKNTETKVVAGSPTDQTHEMAQWTFEEVSTLGITLNGPVDGKYYATLCVPFDITALDGATAYTLTMASDGRTLNSSEVTTIPAGTPVLLEGTTASATATIAAPASTTISTSTALTGQYFASAFDGTTNYTLGTDGTKLGYFHWDGTTLGANRAYVAGSTGGNVKGFYLNFDELVDGIKTIDNGQLTKDDAAIFNLAGQRLSKLQKGVNIVNGKKILVK
jgi:hypothetical protein